MTPEQWHRVREVLAEALALKSGDREAFLDRTCASDRVLRKEVETLLSSGNEVCSSFLQSTGSQITLTPGVKLGDYEVESLLGSGGMGEVYRARDMRLGRDVAIKVLPAVLSRDPERLRRFEQEARAAAALNHPNILAVFQLGTYEAAPYLVSELLEGGTLREQLARGPLSLRKAVDCGVQIAHGLAAAHEKGIVHRDLKPENLFLTREGRLKILDFGLAKLTQNQSAVDSNAPTQTEGTEPGMVMGTVGYMSPEQVNGRKADHRADIFAFGAILYELITGKRAFRKPTSAETMSAILNEDPPGVSQVAPATPPAMQRIVHRCLEKNPEQRFQSASDLAFALEALSDSGGLSASASSAPKRSRPGLALLWWGGGALILLLAALSVVILVMGPKIPVNPSTWVQITTFPDSVTQPALSPDGRLLTFVRGPDTFAGPGQVYVKILPEGEPARLTQDALLKMSPVFSPDGSKIAYTAVVGTNWDTWIVPILGGQPRLWLPNASGLVWPEKGKIVFSEKKDSFVHMATVLAAESRAGERDIYVPTGNLGMVHRSYPSPDAKWALVVEMERSAWLPCRLVPMDGSSTGRQVGPSAAGCTFAAWSPDGKWMYLNSNPDGAFHIWRQRFPDGQPEQVTSGPTEEEGIAMTADGHSFITAVGMRQSSVWLHDSSGERQVSLEGYSFDPKFTPDGKKLCYRILKGTLPASDPSELRVLELDSGRSEALLPGFSVTGKWGVAYDISPDGREVVATVIDHEGRPRLLLAPLDLSSPPSYITNVDGQRPVFGPAGDIFFRAVEGTTSYLYCVHRDGTALRRVIEQPGTYPMGISRDGQWLLARSTREGPSILAYSLRGGSTVAILGDKLLSPGDPLSRWSSGGSVLVISMPTVALGASGRTYVIPLPHGRALPQLPAGGFQSESEIARLPGAQSIDGYDVALGTTPEVYAFARETVQRNLFRVPLR
jgi:eukaryotic-like serine/threonine-protein kinase